MFHAIDNHYKFDNNFSDTEDNLGKLINAQDVHQFLYCFKPKTHLYNDHKQLKGLFNIVYLLFQFLFVTFLYFIYQLVLKLGN